MSKPLSKQSEAKLMAAVQAICDELPEEKYSADQLLDAAVKQAQLNEFGPHMVRLMCYGWNNGSVAQQRESSNSILEKHASFPILDADAVIAKMTDVQKQAMDQTSVVSDVYSRAPRKLYKDTRPKKAEFTATQKDPTEKSASEAFLWQKKYAQAKRLQQEIHDAKRDYRNAERELLHTVCKLAEYFKRDRTREWLFDEVSYAVEQRHGAKAATVMKAAAEINGYTVKAANMRPRKAIDWNASPFSLVAEAIKQAENVALCERSFRELWDDNRFKIAQLMDRLVVPSKQEKSASILTARDKQAAEDKPLEKAALLSGGLSDLAILSTLFNREPGDPKTKDKIVDTMYNDLADPQHEEEINRIRTQTMLRNMLSQDEILSSYNPEELSKAYNNLSQLAPRAAKQPTMANSVLRRWATQGGVEPFEVKEIGDIEKTLKQTQQPGVDKSAEVSPILTDRSKTILG